MTQCRSLKFSMDSILGDERPSKKMKLSSSHDSSYIEQTLVQSDFSENDPEKVQPTLEEKIGVAVPRRSLEREDTLKRLSPDSTTKSEPEPAGSRLNNNVENAGGAIHKRQRHKTTYSHVMVKDGIRVELISHELWSKFHELGTEMIITKAGRRMFPTVKIRLDGLDPKENYIVFMDIEPVDDKRYRYAYHNSQWMVAGSGDPPLDRNMFVHQDSPSTGQLWTSQGLISFDKLKVTNHRSSVIQGHICLHSMHKYVPRLHIQKTADLKTSPELQADISKATTFVFKQTSFTTVTAYQNQQITKLKISSNPFAKGFREATRSRDFYEEDSHIGGYFSHIMDRFLQTNAVPAVGGSPGFAPSPFAAEARRQDGLSRLAAAGYPLLPPMIGHAGNAFAPLTWHHHLSTAGQYKQPDHHPAKHDEVTLQSVLAKGHHELGNLGYLSTSRLFPSPPTIDPLAAIKTPLNTSPTLAATPNHRQASRESNRLSPHQFSFKDFSPPVLDLTKANLMTKT